jgi:integrase
VETQETEILSAEQMADVLAKLDGHALYPIVVLALATGMRRGELLALRWEDLDLERATVSIARFFEETKAGLRFKAPKTKRGYRTISLPPSSIETLRALRRQQLELRMALGQGRPESGALVFSTIEGGALSPDNLSRDGGA